MLFHAFRVVYTVKELDSHAKHGQSLKKTTIWTYDSISVTIILLPGLYKFLSFFSERGSSRRKRGWNSLFGHFSRKNAPVHASTGARGRARPSMRFIRQHWTGLAQEQCL